MFGWKGCFVLSLIILGIALFCDKKSLHSTLSPILPDDLYRATINVMPKILKDAFDINDTPKTLPKPSKPIQERILTKEELKRYGKDNSDTLMLGIMGKVFDVSAQQGYYGAGGGYSFFSGIDGSRAYITGEFNEAGLIDDVSTFSPQQMKDLQDWVEFYTRDYIYVGKVIGYFYDEKGQETDALKHAYTLINKAKDQKEVDKLDKKNFPSCNSEWIKDEGGRVWCSKKSGGIERDWEGVPRKYRQPGKSNSKERCACIRNTGPPTGHPDEKTNNGDLDIPYIKEYEKCNPESVSCKLVRS